MPQQDDAGDFHPRRYKPTKETKDYAFAILPDVALPQGVSCAVRIENKAYFAAMKGVCDRFMLSETLTTLPTWLKEVSPGLFHSGQSAMFTAMMLNGMQITKSEELLRAAAPDAAKAKREAWVDPTDAFLHMFGETGPNGNEDDEDDMSDGIPFSHDPKDHLFAARTITDGGRTFTDIIMVDRAYHEARGGPRDQEIDPDGLPDHVRQVAESVFESDRPLDVVRRDLEAAGMTWSKDLADMMQADQDHADRMFRGEGGGEAPLSTDPKDYIFAVAREMEGKRSFTRIYMVDRAYHAAESCIRNEEVHPRGLPGHVWQDSESCFLSERSMEEVRRDLQALGMTEHPALVKQVADEFGSDAVTSSNKPSDYVYGITVDDVPGYGTCTVVALVERSFFEANGHMDDIHVSEVLNGLPTCMEELQEGTFASKTSPGELCMMLESMGISSSPAFDAFLKDPGASSPRP